MRRGEALAAGWRPPDLTATVAAVTGASYGVGRGICEVLGQCGATVYITGRSTRDRPETSARWTIEDTADLVEQGGGRAVPVVVDYTSTDDVRRLFEQIERDRGRLDLLVNNVWQWGPRDSYWAPTWEQPIERWDAMFGVGVRGHLLATRFALPLMLDDGGLIVSTQERPGDDHHFADNIVVDGAAVAMQRMTQYLGRELRSTSVTPVLVYLGWVRSVNMGMGFDPEEVDMTEAELHAVTQSTHLVGRAIAELAADMSVHDKAGATFYCGDLALEYGFTDIDGRIPGYDGQ